jgi:hypothetical protein
VRHATLRGTVINNPAGQETPSPIMLLESDGTMVGLWGEQLTALSTVIGAEVDVQGQFDDVELLTVESFVVVAVGGQPASDGVLERTEDGYGLRLMTGGVRDIKDPSQELQLHVGDRLWITGPDDGPPTAFGVIAVGDAAKA